MSFRIKVLAFGGVSVVLLTLGATLISQIFFPKVDEHEKNLQILAEDKYFKYKLPLSADEKSGVITIQSEKALKMKIEPSSASSHGSITPINLNTASKTDLIQLPGIGEVLAERILEKRKELGGFTSVEQLLLVKGIGEKKLGRIRGLVVVE